MDTKPHLLFPTIAIALCATFGSGCSSGLESSGRLDSGPVSFADSSALPNADASWLDPPLAPDAAALPDQGCAHSWELGSYGPCSASCGDGIQTRKVQCLRCDGVVVADGLCPQPAPESQQSCSDQSGCSYSYGAWSAWSACTAKQRTRTRQCLRSDGSSAACSECGGNCSETKPCCQDTNVVHAGGKAACESSVAQIKAQCLADGCNWGGPDICTIGGSPSSSSAYGVVVSCF